MPKLSFKAVDDKISVAKLKAVKKKRVSAALLVGRWENCDKKTRGPVRVVLRGNLVVQVFGACVPRPCDWGKVRGVAYSESVSSTRGVAFTAHYDHGFATRIVTGHLHNGCLHIQIYTVFKDGSGRCPYYWQGCFCRR